MRDNNTTFDAMPTGELMRLRTELNVSLALAAPGSAVRGTAERELHRISVALAAREREGTPPGMIQLHPGRGGTGELWRHPRPPDPAGIPERSAPGRSPPDGGCCMPSDMSLGRLVPLCMRPE
jgi:hypothetical protein